jgi:hypothetical protein
VEDEGHDVPIDDVTHRPLVAPGLVDHAEAVVAVVDLGEAGEEVASGDLRLVELAGPDRWTTALDTPSRSSSSASASSSARARERVASRASSAFARAAASFSRQQRLYFLPLPQGQPSSATRTETCS